MSRRLGVVAALIVVSFLSLAGRAHGQITLAKPADGWEVFTSGRIGAFVEVLQGDGIPQTIVPQIDPVTGMPLPEQMVIHPVGDGGVVGASDPVVLPGGVVKNGPLLASRVRSGFLGNILGFGVRRQLTARTLLTGYISIWGTTETDSRRTFYKNFPDEREGYMKVEGPAGSLLVGRALSLYSRGAVEIDFLYGHGFGVGNPAGFDEHGPTAGHIGYGVIAPVFVGGVQYATPKLFGLQLTAGYFDPGTLVGLYWVRTKFGRPEAEATYDLEFGKLSKLHLFVNGAWQRMYANDTPRSADVYGGGAGGRVEVGPLHLGVAAHSGQGLGVGYFLDGSDAVLNQYANQQLRKFSGLYVQSQVVAGKFDFNVGWGVTRIEPLSVDSDSMWCQGVATPCGGFDASGLPSKSFLKSQMGGSAVIVYHLFPYLHLAADYFLSDVKWQQGEQQIVNAFNLGSTLTW